MAVSAIECSPKARRFKSNHDQPNCFYCPFCIAEVKPVLPKMQCSGIEKALQSSPGHELCNQKPLLCDWQEEANKEINWIDKIKTQTKNQFIVKVKTQTAFKRHPLHQSDRVFFSTGLSYSLSSWWWWPPAFEMGEWKKCTNSWELSLHRVIGSLTENLRTNLRSQIIPRLEYHQMTTHHQQRRQQQQHHHRNHH